MHILALALLTACGTPSAPVDASPVAAPPAPEPVAASAAHVALTLDPGDLAYDEAAGTATFSPDSRVKAAAYTHYVFDLASLEAAVGRPTEPVTVTVEVTATEERTVVPEDPAMSAPDGGFRITTHTARVVARVP